VVRELHKKGRHVAEAPDLSSAPAWCQYRQQCSHNFCGQQPSLTSTPAARPGNSKMSQRLCVAHFAVGFGQGTSCVGRLTLSP
jgi:hypothetical protein